MSQTRVQAKQHMMNLKEQLESNELLKNDLGPFQEETDEWGTTSLVFSNLNARIMVASYGQSIRGLRHNQYRPGLIIGDDVEDIPSTRTKESRDKTYQWLKGEVIPCGDRHSQLVIVGNLLHNDSLLMRIKKEIGEGKMNGVFRSYPLLDEEEKCLWPGKYPDEKSIIEEKRRLGDERAWQREYLLHIIRDDDQIITPDQIHYYDGPPPDDCRAVFIGVDLAISEKETADYTAVITIAITGYGKDFRAFVLPNTINRRMDFPTTIDEIKRIYNSLKKNFRNVSILIESVGYQKAAVQMLVNENYPAEEVKVSDDKRSRLMTISMPIQNGKILFPRRGAENLIGQITGFGIERYDDLVDAFTIIGQRIIDEDKPSPGRLSDLYGDFDENAENGKSITGGLLDRVF